MLAGDVGNRDEKKLQSLCFRIYDKVAEVLREYENVSASQVGLYWTIASMTRLPSEELRLKLLSAAYIHIKCLQMSMHR